MRVIIDRISNIKYIDQLIWITALLFLYFMDASKESYSFCFFKLIGFQSCPGCGIGHSIHHVLHFHFQESLNDHILGIPATIIILYYIAKPFISTKKLIKQLWTSNKC